MNRKYRMVIGGEVGIYQVDWRTNEFTRADGSAEHLLVPGFVDLHIHGAFGIDYMTATSSEIRTLCSRLREVGYEAFLPTTVTASPEDVMHALEALPDDPMIRGFHLEGPFISAVFPGAQPKDGIAQPSGEPSAWTPILFDPRLRRITLAPEIPGGFELIEKLARRGVQISLGHTNATFEECSKAFALGSRHTTHTYNAMRPLHHREAGTVGYALLNDDVYTELIYDRLHVSPPAARLLVKSKPIDKLIAVSDSTMAAGMPSGKTLQMWGLECIVGEQQVRLKDGTLAGSAITLLDAFRNLCHDFGEVVAIHACSLNPRRLLNMDDPQVWVEFDRNLEIVAVRTP